MNNAKKFALIPLDTLSKLQLASQMENVGPLAVASDYNKKLQSVLNSNSTLPPDIKARQYGQLYNQFESFKDSELRKPVKIPLIKELQQHDRTVQQPRQQAAHAVEAVAQTSPVYSQELPLSENDILKGITAKTSKPFAWNLLQAIKLNENIRWDSSGNVVVRGKKIPQTGILRIVSDLSRNVKSTPPRGSLEVARELLENNDAKYIIGNVQRRRFLQEPNFGSDDSDNFASTSSRTKTPKRRFHFQSLYAERGSGSVTRKKQRPK